MDAPGIDDEGNGEHGSSRLDRASDYIDQTEKMLEDMAKVLQEGGKEVARDKARLHRPVQQRKSYIQYLRRQVRLKRIKAQELVEEIAEQARRTEQRRKQQEEEARLAREEEEKKREEEEAKIRELKQKARDAIEQYAALDRVGSKSGKRSRDPQEEEEDGDREYQERENEEGTQVTQTHGKKV